MLFLQKKNIRRNSVISNFEHVLYGSSPPAHNPAPSSDITVCDKDIYKMSYNMETIKKRVAQLFIAPDATCYYFESIGITNLNLTTYNDFIHEQAKICFKILSNFETSHKITFAVFAGNSIGLLRAGKNLPWSDDYDIILFKHDVAFFMSHIIPELEKVGFIIKIKIVNGIVSGAKIFGPPVIVDYINYNNSQSMSIFQCDVFFSYFDTNGFLKNIGGWSLYHKKNIPRNAVFPLKRRQFHGMLLPFFNDSLKEVELCYGNIQKCSIFSHHIDSTIFYKRWENAYKDFDHIKTSSIINTRNYITHNCKHGSEAEKKTLLLTSSAIPRELCDVLFDDSNHFHISISKKLDFLRYLHDNNIGVIVISPLIFLKERCNTNFLLEKLKHKKKIDAADYNYYAPGLKIIGDHAADIKYYFPNIKIIYEESVDDVHGDGDYALSPLFYNYISIIRVTKMRYDQVYQKQSTISKKYRITIPTIEIIES